MDLLNLVLVTSEKEKSVLLFLYLDRPGLWLILRQKSGHVDRMI